MLTHSQETLTHFSCQACKGWWTIGDWKPAAALWCPHCGYWHSLEAPAQPRSLGQVKHWYNISYMGTNLVTKKCCSASVRVGFINKELSKHQLDFHKATAGLAYDAAIISVSYLGAMTHEEFMRGSR